MQICTIVRLVLDLIAFFGVDYGPFKLKLKMFLWICCLKMEDVMENNKHPAVFMSLVLSLYCTNGCLDSCEVVYFVMAVNRYKCDKTREIIAINQKHSFALLC